LGGIKTSIIACLIMLFVTFTKKNLITKKKSLTQSMGKRSLLQISQRQKPKRTLKNLQTITTSKVPF